MSRSRLLLLPTDIICEIFCCLCVRDAIRLSCVCKYLKSLSSNEHINLPYYHLCHSSHKKNSLLIFDDVYYYPSTSTTACRDPKQLVQKFENMKLTDPLYLGDVRFVGSSNGIICFGKSPAYDSNTTIIYLWNPSLQQIRTLPQTSIDLVIWYSNFQGFTYDVSNQDHKFIQVLFFGKIDIYSLKSNSWKRIDCASTPKRYCYGHFVLDFNGCLYWISVLNTCFGVYESIKVDVKCSIISFNIASEKLGEYPIPCAITNNGMFCGMGVFKGCFSFLIYYHHNDKYEIWSMGVKSDKSWTKTHGFDHNKLLHGDEFSDRLENRRTYCFLFTPSGKIINRRTGQVMLFDLETDHMDIINLKKRSNSRRLLATNYVESLFSVMPTEKDGLQVANNEVSQISPIPNEEKKKKTRTKRWLRCFFG